MKIFVCVFAIIAALAAFLSPAAAESGYYSVVAEVLPIMTEAGAKYEMNGNRVVDDVNIWGVVVYGNLLELKSSKTEGWFDLLDPEDGLTLGYIPAAGVEKAPDYKETGTKYYMALKDAPELLLYPGKTDKKYKLSEYGYALLKGEVVPSVGERGGELLFGFGTFFETGNEGVGGRYAWGNKKDFVALDSYKADFGKPDPASMPSKIRVGYNPDGYEDVENEAVMELPAEIFSRVSEYGFAIGQTPLFREYYSVDDMADFYRETGNYEVDFITADIFTHSFHLLFDHALQKLERVYLASALEKSLNAASAELEKSRKSIPDGAQPSLETAYGLFSTALALLTGDAENVTLSPSAAEEASRVIDAAEVAESGVTGRKIDYTAFEPRGHYTLTPESGQYFRAVGYIGSAELPLFDEAGQPIIRNVTTAALISLVLDGVKSWEAFEEPINFLVGVPNSGDPKVLRALVRKHIGAPGKEESYKNLSDEPKILALAEDIKKSAVGPAIQSVAGGDRKGADFDGRLPVFRISGRRFTWDAYVLNRLTSPRVGTDKLPRNLPEGTDVMAALGSGAGDEYARKNDKVKNYRESLDALKGEAADYLSKENTVYAKWLSVFKAGFEDSGAAQFFYRSPAWRWKKLSTYLASWAELKHDTILYAEQSGAEMGGGDDLWAGRFAPPSPRGYVEPDPKVFGALLAAVQDLAGLIEKYDMEPPADEDDYEASSDIYKDKLDAFAELLKRAGAIAKKEAGGEALTLEDYAAIKEIARGFRGEILLPGYGQFVGEDIEEQLKMALVADVATDYLGNRVLEIASGAPRKIYVFVNDASGGARLTRGYVYSYYEFARPLGKGRMTDEEWKSLVYDTNRAEELKKYLPAWSGELEK